MPKPPPLRDTLGDLPEKLARYDLDEMHLYKHKMYDIAASHAVLAACVFFLFSSVMQLTVPLLSGGGKTKMCPRVSFVLARKGLDSWTRKPSRGWVIERAAFCLL